MIARYALLLLVALYGCSSSEVSPDPTELAKDSPDKRIADAERAAKEAKAAEAKARAEKNASEERASLEMAALATKNYWERCADINKQSISDKSEIWFKEFRPGAIEATCREAARRLRELDNSNVDPQVIDHVNRAIRGYETIGAIAKVKGQESLLRDAGDTLKFIYSVSKAGRVGAFADSGWIEMGIGLSAGGEKATAEGQAQTSSIASSIVEAEETLIRTMREKYGVELKPW